MGPNCGFGVLVTSLEDERLTVARLYGNRPDVENALDEMETCGAGKG